MQRRELTLLARDRNFLVQTTVMPVLIVGMQWVLTGRIEAFAQVWSNPPTVAAGVFGVATYALMLSAFSPASHIRSSTPSSNSTASKLSISSIEVTTPSLRLKP